MDRKSVSFSATYPSVRLYQDDLAYIFHVLSQSKDIQISDQEFKYQSLDEVEKQRGKTFGSLYIHASEPTSMIELSNKKHSSNRVFSEDPGIFHLLDDLLTSSTLPIVRWFIKLEWLIWVAVLAIFIGVAVVVFKAGYLGLLFLPLLGLAGVLAFYSGFYSSVLTRNAVLNEIHLIPKHASVSFWKKNSDKIALVVIGTVIGAFGTIITQLILKLLRFSK